MDISNKIESLIAQASKLEKTKGFWEYFDSYATLERYDQIATLYERAGNLSKITNPFQTLTYLIKSYNFRIMSAFYSDEYKIKSLIQTIAELYVPIDYTKAIEYYERIVNYYSEKGDIINICEIYERIGNIYIDNNQLVLANEVFEKIIRIAGSNDKLTNIITRSNEVLAEFEIKNSNFIKAADIYRSLGTFLSNTKLGKYLAKKYFFLGILSACAGDDLVKATNLNDLAVNSDHTFATSNNGIFVSKLIENLHDEEFLSQLSSERDSLTILTPIEVTLLLAIKNNTCYKSDELNDQIDLS